MNEAFIDRVAQRIIDRLLVPSVELEASGRHVHLNREAVEILFGQGYTLTKAADLSQPGQFACRERVTLAGTKKSIANVVVLGPERPESQVEVSATDALALGLKVPVRMSGDIAGTPGIRLVGPAGELDIRAGVIVAMRHIHITPEDAVRFGVADKQAVDVRVGGDRGLVFRNAVVRVSPQFATYMHIDYDEANACGFAKGMQGELLVPEKGR